MFTNERAAAVRSSQLYLSCVTTATSLYGPRWVVSHRLTSPSATRHPVATTGIARATATTAQRRVFFPAIPDLDSDDDSTLEALASPRRFQGSPMLTGRPRRP